MAEEAAHTPIEKLVLSRAQFDAQVTGETYVGGELMEAFSAVELDTHQASAAGEINNLGALEELLEKCVQALERSSAEQDNDGLLFFSAKADTYSTLVGLMSPKPVDPPAPTETGTKAMSGKKGHK